MFEYELLDSGEGPHDRRGPEVVDDRPDRLVVRARGTRNVDHRRDLGCLGQETPVRAGGEEVDGVALASAARSPVRCAISIASRDVASADGSARSIWSCARRPSARASDGDSGCPSQARLRRSPPPRARPSSVRAARSRAHQAEGVGEQLDVAFRPGSPDRLGEALERPLVLGLVDLDVRREDERPRCSTGVDASSSARPSRRLAAPGVPRRNAESPADRRCRVRTLAEPLRPVAPQRSASSRWNLISSVVSACRSGTASASHSAARRCSSPRS